MLPGVAAYGRAGCEAPDACDTGQLDLRLNLRLHFHNLEVPHLPGLAFKRDLVQLGRDLEHRLRVRVVRRFLVVFLRGFAFQ